MDVMKVESGEELDALVAEALGCKPARDDADGPWYCTCSHLSHATSVVNDLILDIKPYSTAPAAALALLETFSQYRITKHKRMDGTLHYAVLVMVKESGFGSEVIGGEATADTFPLAACHAVLRAKGEQP